mmetsp:Transcript_22142/g.56882  ORF Transcript_22142/g.56882 Transcript_22142/m.56882 type:complete len:287 (+) Transcript_22142:604-1464(+)
MDGAVARVARKVLRQLHHVLLHPLVHVRHHLAPPLDQIGHHLHRLGQALRLHVLARHGDQLGVEVLETGAETVGVLAPELRSGVIVRRGLQHAVHLPERHQRRACALQRRPARRESMGARGLVGRAGGAASEHLCLSGDHGRCVGGGRGARAKRAARRVIAIEEVGDPIHDLQDGEHAQLGAHDRKVRAPERRALNILAFAPRRHETADAHAHQRLDEVVLDLVCAVGVQRVDVLPNCRDPLIEGAVAGVHHAEEVVAEREAREGGPEPAVADARASPRPFAGRQA